MKVVYVVMGVSGSGKTSVGKGIAQRLGLPFYDGDDFHPASNKAKMVARIPLTDAERHPWLERIRQLMPKWEENGGAVLACSALKESYRDILRGAPPLPSIRFVYLRVSPEEVARRLRQRKGHFFPKELLTSQFATLEEPTDALWVETRGLTNEEIVSKTIFACS